MADAVALYARVVRTAIRAQLQYRLSFALDVLGNLLATSLDFVAILVIFHNVPALDGWSVEEVAFLYATSALAFTLVDLLIGHLDYLPRLVRDGTFDLFLVRPRTTLLQVATSDFSLRKVGKGIQGAGVLVYALIALDVDWTAGRVAMVPLTVLLGAAIFASVWVAAICTVFWLVETSEIANSFSYGGLQLTQYPITVYDRWLRVLLAYVVPLAFVCYFPSLYVLDKDDPLGLPGWLPFLSPVVAAAAALAACVAWRTAVRHYRSAGG